MLKINLLPPHIHQRKLMKVAAIVVACVLLLEVAVVYAARQQPLAHQQALQAELQEKNSGLEKVKGLETESSTVLAEEQKFAPKFDFFKQVMEYNEALPDLYQETARYTYSEATMLNLEASGNTLRFTAYVADPADVSRLMLGLSRSSLFTGPPQITGVPGWRQIDQLRKQAKESGMPLDSLIIGGGVAPGSPSMFGGIDPGAMGGMMGPADAGMGGGMDSGGGGGGGADAMAGMYGGMMGPADAGMGGGMDSGGGGGAGDLGMAMTDDAMSGAPGGMMGGGGGAGAPATGLGSLDIGLAARKPKGFVVTVTCTLRKPIQRPGGGGAAAAGGGMTDMYGGAMGGMMGGGMDSGGGGGGAPVAADMAAPGGNGP